MTLGPQVAFIDDIENQISPLSEAFTDLNIGSAYFNAKPEEAKYPENYLESIELVFLDLYYKDEFDPEMCAQWIECIVPPNKQYNLVIWSKDTHQLSQVLDILDVIQRTPASWEAWQKTEYDLNTFDFKPRISELIETIQNSDKVIEDIFYGEILDIEDDGVLVNCLINEDKPAFQIRKFDNYLLSAIKNLEPGTHVKIQILNRPGSRLINIYEEITDRSELFSVVDFFKGLENGAFFIEG